MKVSKQKHLWKIYQGRRCFKDYQWSYRQRGNQNRVRRRLRITFDFNTNFENIEHPTVTAYVIPFTNVKPIDPREWPCSEPECEGEFKHVSTSPGYSASTEKYACTICGHSESFP